MHRLNPPLLPTCLIKHLLLRPFGGCNLPSSAAAPPAHLPVQSLLQSSNPITFGILAGALISPRTLISELQATITYCNSAVELTTPRRTLLAPSHTQNISRATTRDMSEHRNFYEAFGYLQHETASAHRSFNLWQFTSSRCLHSPHIAKHPPQQGTLRMMVPRPGSVCSSCS